MRFLEAKLRLESPAVLTSRRTERGYVSPLNVIPGSMLRGALLSMLYNHGLIDEKFLEAESHNPRVIASPAYPMMDDKKSYPCHLFAYKCKVMHGDGSEEGFERKIYAAETIKILEAGLEPEFKRSCSRGHVALEEVHPKPVIPVGDTFREISLFHEHIVCVGISRERATAQRQLLYEYESVAAGHEFWFKMGVPEDVLDGIERGMRLYIGRGSSRGFGRARITEIREAPLDDLIEKIHQTYRDNSIIALYSISNVISTLGNQYYPYPEEIDLDALRRLGLDVSGKLVVRRAYGRCVPLSLGWDIARNVRRPVLEQSLAPGSILVSSIRKGENWEKGLAAISYVGRVEVLQPPSGGSMPITGVNVLEPLAFNPMVGR
ncbi:MAG: hypothetical protein NZ918_03280 [Aigarchaeota archaeon]|nr:hypothetical protein [Aigarchaeota archaeon]